jgi:integrase/recombinase XerD
LIYTEIVTHAASAVQTPAGHHNEVTGEVAKAIQLLQQVTMVNIKPRTVALVIQEYVKIKAIVLSPHTLADYGLTFRRFLEFINTDRPIHEITVDELRDFFITIPGGKKNRQNAHIGLSALWTFAINEGYTTEHAVKKVELAPPDKRAIIPFSKSDVEKLLETALTDGRDKKRNISIIKVLLDTGVRASELCGLTLNDVEGEYLRVFGKGSKERQVPISPIAMNAVVDYLNNVRHADKRTAPLFLSETGVGLDRHALRLMLNRLSERSGVRNVYPHKFRHTFAVNYLLNGGDPYSLQMILGHSTMDMVKRYLYLTNRDIAAVHNRATPLRHWGL